MAMANNPRVVDGGFQPIPPLERVAGTAFFGKFLARQDGRTFLFLPPRFSEFTVSRSYFESIMPGRGPEISLLPVGLNTTAG
jgi:hypothetical protein